MKKIALTLFLVVCLSSVSSAAGKFFGVEASNLIADDPLGYMTLGKGMFFLQFNDALSAGIGIIDVSNPIPSLGETQNWLGVQLKGQWNLGKGLMIPHLAAEIDSVSGNIAAPGDDVIFNTLTLAIMYGVEVSLLPDLSVILDARLIEVGNLHTNYSIYNDSYTAILSGGTFGIRWYIL